MSPDAALAVCRFLHDASAMLVWGSSLYLWLLAAGDIGPTIGRRLRPFAVAAVALAAATTIIALPLETALIGDGWSYALDLPTIRDVVFDTSVGEAWQVQAVMAVILLGTLAVPTGIRPAAMAAASGLLLAALALTGHAVMQDGWLGAAHRLNDAVHVLSAGAWLGALVPLLLILKRLGASGEHRETIDAPVSYTHLTLPTIYSV